MGRTVLRLCHCAHVVSGPSPQLKIQDIGFVAITGWIPTSWFMNCFVDTNKYELVFFLLPVLYPKHGKLTITWIFFLHLPSSRAVHQNDEIFTYVHQFKFSSAGALYLIILILFIFLSQMWTEMPVNMCAKF